MDTIDYELKIIDLLVDAYDELSSEEFELLLIRIARAINYFEK